MKEVPLYTIRVEQDIYSRCVGIAKSYYSLLRRQKEIEEEIIHETPTRDGQPGAGIGNPTALKAERILKRQTENNRKIKAIEQARVGLADETKARFIEMNLFENIPMDFIYGIPYSRATMRRTRKTFLVLLAMELHEI